MASPHLLLYTDDPGFGGTAHYNAAILNAFALEGFRLTTVTSPGDNPLLAHQKSLGIEQVFLSFDAIADFPRSLRNDAEAEAIFTRVRPQVILFSNNCPFSNFAAKRVARRLGIPYLVVEAFVAPYLAQNFAQLVPELTEHYRSARAVVAVSQENLGLLRTLFGLAASAGQVIHYGRPEEFFTPRNPEARQRIRASLGIPEEGIACITTARLEAVKGYQFQLEAIDRLRRSPLWPRLHFLWVGGGSMEGDIRKAIEQRGIGAQVHLLGQRWDIPDLLDASDIFLLPSALEGMPLAIMEAMAKSLPIVASAVSGIPEELGPTGKLLSDPKVNPAATVEEIVSTLTQWAEDAGLRERLGVQAHARARQLFHVSRMVRRTRSAVDHALLPKRDYVSPEFEIVQPDGAFPNMAVGDVTNHPFPFLRREIPHNWYCDQRHPVIGFASRDEAAILYNTALLFKGKAALEIGCWMGWSACHLALGGVELDVIDPVLENADVRASVESSLRSVGVLEKAHLHAGASPAFVDRIAAQQPAKKWSLIFIDGDHAHPGPLNDTIAVLPHAAADAAILFHDLASPDVAAALHYLRAQGWNTLVYQTMQIMAIAYRGNVVPPDHVPDPSIQWPLPAHLAGYRISGMATVPAAAQGVQHHGTMASGAPIISFGKAPAPPQPVTRQQIAERVLSANAADLPGLMQSHVAPMVAALRKESAILSPLSPGEAAYIDSLAPRLQANHPGAILAASLFRQAYQLPLPVRLDDVPDFLLDFYLDVLFFSPQIFTAVGEPERYAQFLKQWVSYLHAEILRNPQLARWQKVRMTFFQRANFIPLYFTDGNLREAYSQRGDIIASTLEHAGVRLAHTFPARTEKKIRLGILAQHFGPVPETFAALPVYEHLGEEFETTLYAVQKVDHRLAQYCASRAKTLRVLPTELHDQVAMIRRDELDILFLATNVTAVLNNITVLAAHRLARHQTTSIASVTTTGLANVDSYLSSQATDPAADAPTHYREKLKFLDDPAAPIHCFSYGTEKNTATYAPTRAMLNVPDNVPLFVSGANVYKILPELQLTWARLLARVPESRLLLYPYGINWSSAYAKQAFVATLAKHFTAHGVDPKRLCLLDPPLERTPNRDDIKQFLKLADVYLDSYPFGGSTSIVDPLEVGLPPVIRTSVDASLRSAMSAAMLKSIGLHELVTLDEDAYIALAAELANDATRRESLRQRILTAMQSTPPFLDSPAYGQKMARLLKSLIAPS